MVKSQPVALDAVFGALADPTRRSMIERLGRGDSTVGELAAPFEVSLPAISKHLTVLERAGLVHRQRDGRVRRCHLNVEPIEEAAAWVDEQREYWDERLDALAEFLEKQKLQKGSR